MVLGDGYLSRQDGKTGPKTRVLIVDDTRTIRALIRAMLSVDPRIDVVGEASDPYEARDLIKSLQPDVITLDVEMPRMNGLQFLEKLMRLRPVPVVMVSMRTVEQSDEAIKALALGAIDCIDLGRLKNRDPRLPDLAETILAASRAQISRRRSSVGRRTDEVSRNGFSWNGRVVLIGSSTGGVDALLTVIGGLPANCAPTVIAQHMPQHFLRSFAQRLNAHSAPSVSIAEDGEKLVQGRVLLAPGGSLHAELTGVSTPRIRLRRDDGTALYVPSVERLFGSAEDFASMAIAVMLTGMGRDGAREMRRLRDAGATTIAQSSDTCIVDGMPKAAREEGAAQEVVALENIPSRVVELSSSERTRALH